MQDVESDGEVEALFVPLDYDREVDRAASAERGANWEAPEANIIGAPARPGLGDITYPKIDVSRETARTTKLAPDSMDNSWKSKNWAIATRVPNTQ